MRKSAKERLRQFYQQFSGEDHVLIPINADPDAIASAMAVKRLLWRQITTVTIASVNEIKAQAIREGMQTLIEAGVARAVAGESTLEEVRQRVLVWEQGEQENTEVHWSTADGPPGGRVEAAI